MFCIYIIIYLLYLKFIQKCDGLSNSVLSNVVNTEFILDFTIKKISKRTVAYGDTIGTSPMMSMAFHRAISL